MRPLTRGELSSGLFRRILESLGLISSNAGRIDVPAHVSIALLLIAAGIAVLIPGLDTARS